MSEHPEENNELEDQNDETLYEHHKFIAEKAKIRFVLTNI